MAIWSCTSTTATDMWLKPSQFVWVSFVSGFHQGRQLKNDRCWGERPYPRISTTLVNQALQSHPSITSFPHNIMVHMQSDTAFIAARGHGNHFNSRIQLNIDWAKCCSYLTSFHSPNGCNSFGRQRLMPDSPILHVYCVLRICASLCLTKALYLGQLVFHQKCSLFAVAEAGYDDGSGSSVTSGCNFAVFSLAIAFTIRRNRKSTLMQLGKPYCSWKPKHTHIHTRTKMMWRIDRRAANAIKMTSLQNVLLFHVVFVFVLFIYQGATSSSWFYVFGCRSRQQYLLDALGRAQECMCVCVANKNVCHTSFAATSRNWRRSDKNMLYKHKYQALPNSRR